MKIRKLHRDAVIPKYQTKHSAGFDLHSVWDYCFNPGQTILIPTGLAVEFQPVHCLQLVSRSGWAKKGLVVINSPGIIDADYRGEVLLLMKNISQETIMIFAGDRIAQGLIVPIVQVSIEEVSDLSDTDRGQGGFGSTGN